MPWLCVLLMKERSCWLKIEEIGLYKWIQLKKPPLVYGAVNQSARAKNSGTIAAKTPPDFSVGSIHSRTFWLRDQEIWIVIFSDT